MESEIKTTTSAPVTVAPTTSKTVASTSVIGASAPVSANRAPSRDTRAPRGGRRPQRFDKERVKPEFDTKIIGIRRVTRVASGGRKFTFSVSVVSGDRKGRVGVGMGKAGDTSLAIDKATRNAKKNMIKVTLSPTMNIPHMVEGKFCSSRVMIMPAKGRGVVAGSSVRNVIELAGIKDVCAKLLSGSKNKFNNARVAIDALKQLSKNPRTNNIKEVKVTETK